MSVKRFIAGSLLAGLLATAAFAQVSNYNPGPATGSGGPTTLTGDVTGTGTGTVAATIPNGTITLPKMANLAANSVLGNNTGSPATPLALTTAQTKSLLAIANTDVSGLGTASAAATGTSGHTLGFLDGANNVSNSLQLSGNISYPGNASANGFLYHSNVNGLVMDGEGSTYDWLLLNKLGNSVAYVGTGSSIFTTNGSISPQSYLYQPTSVAGPGAAASAGWTFYNSVGGLVLEGQGSTNDVTLFNNAGTTAVRVPTGTTNLIVAGSLGVGGVTAFNTSGVLQAASFPALTGDVTNTAGTLGTTIGAGAVSLAKQANFAATSLQGNPTGSPAAPSAITLAGGLGFSGTTLTAAGALTPTSVASTGSILSSGATGGIGYATGAGGAVTQITSRTTGVTNNKACGAITMFSAAGAATWATFVVTDSAVAATDVIVTSVKSATNLYLLSVTGVGSGTFNLSFATTGGTATDAPVINYCDIKGVAA